MTGRVCDKHGEWCPTGECRWCEAPIGLAVLVPPASVFGIMNVDPNPLVPLPRCYGRDCNKPLSGSVPHPYAPGGIIHFCADHDIRWAIG